MALYEPGNEPDNIKKRLNVLFPKLDSAYPDKHIVGLYTVHKHWGDTVSELYKELGYPDGKSFLEAYGYTYGGKDATGGRPRSFDPEAIINALKEKYPNGTHFNSVDDLFDDNPEYKPKVKTLGNISTEVFGMPLKKYLLSIGLIQGKEKILPKGKKYYVCKVKLDAVNDLIYCIAPTRNIETGVYVEVNYGIYDFLVYATVVEVEAYYESSLPCDIEKIKNITKVIKTNVYNAGLEGSILHTYAAYMTDQLISQKEVAEFEPKEYSCERQEDKILWACCRGLSVEIIRVLDYLIEKDILTYDIKEMLIVEDGICELKVYGEDVEDILKKYPNVKVAMFAENKRNNKVMMYYSRSGADNITDMYEIGTCDLSDEKKWTLRHSPTESCFVEGDVQYTFKYEDDWNECNYVYDCNNMKYQLGK